MITISERLIFYEKLEKLISAGNSLDQALGLCSRGKSSTELNQSIRIILKGLKKNQKLDVALKMVTSLPKQERVLLAAGHQSGKFPTVSKKLIFYLESLLKLKKAFIAAILPNFALIQLAALVLPTINVIATGGSAQAVLSKTIILLAILNTFVYLGYKNSNAIFSTFASLFLKIPIISSAFINYEQFKFYLIYSQFVSAGLPFNESFSTALSILSETPLKKEFKNALYQVKDGKTIFPALYRSKYISNDNINQWEIAYETGQEDISLEKLSMRCLDELLSKLKLISFIIQKVVFGAVFVTIFFTAKGLMDSQIDFLDSIGE